MSKNTPPKIFTVAGLKGGVGKSACSAAIALELKRRGVRVGLLDADVDSPFISEMIGAQGKVGLDDERRMVPVDWKGIPTMSFALWVPDAFQGASMAGSMHARWIADAIDNTSWGDIDVLVADLPAGSGDEYLTVKSRAGDRFVGLVVVTLPHLASTLQRVYNTASYGHARILGVIENMSGPVFGVGRVKDWCAKHGIRFLGTIPLDQRIRERHERHEVDLPDDLQQPIRNAAETIIDACGIKVVAR
jgi:ATP-binding protein involved in chromosome partitioning